MTWEEYVDPYTGKQVKEGKSKAPLGAASESVAVGKPWSYALRGLCILPARPVVMIRRRIFHWHEDVIGMKMSLTWRCLNTFLLSALICRIKTAPPFYYGRGPILGFCIFLWRCSVFPRPYNKTTADILFSFNPMIAASGFSTCPKLLKCLSLQAAFAGPLKVPTQRLAYSLFVSLETY